MSRLRLLYLRWREEWLLAQVLNEESLARNADQRAAKYRRQARAYALELEKVQRAQMLEVPAKRVLREAA